MAGFSDTTETAILALIFNATTWAGYARDVASPETNIACALHTADPGDDGTMATNEIDYSGYARLVGPARTSDGFTVSGGSVSPAANINFGVGTADTPRAARHASLGKSGGGAAPILMSGVITPPIQCGLGVTPTMSIGSTFTLD